MHFNLKKQAIIISIISLFKGIGFHTALDFAKRNARVILACRDLVKGQAAVDKIQEITGNKDVVVMKLDLSLMKSVRDFAQVIIEKETRLDILVNNAGVTGIVPYLI